ncbi:unnamed protein product, partial [Durusdinium trenchii]
MLLSCGQKEVISNPSIDHKVSSKSSTHGQVRKREQESECRWLLQMRRNRRSFTRPSAAAWGGRVLQMGHRQEQAKTRRREVVLTDANQLQNDGGEGPSPWFLFNAGARHSSTSVEL